MKRISTPTIRKKARRAPIRCSHGILLSEKCAKCEIDSNDLRRHYDFDKPQSTVMNYYFTTT